MLDIIQIPVLRDNYTYLIRSPGKGIVAVVDPAEPACVLAVLQERGWPLHFVLNTHHHGDHVGGNLALKAHTGCQIAGPRAEARRIPGIDLELGEGDQLALGDELAQVLGVPGHTLGHIAFWFASSSALFCGDSLFALGCGRMFEGSPEEMWASLVKLRALPRETRIFCAHEYTEANLLFAESIESGNAELKRRGRLIRSSRAQSLPTVPSLMGEECQTNPFLRADAPSLRQKMGAPWHELEAHQVFGELRRRKDVFRA